ncbi:hypothetical protein DDZ14_18455 [Maritimibacter sp. 55A14]|uniref:DUF1636 family protein n=1 Tax=Maritimibacter sp. 55A14 TaxID=2174844 RepID=UPI000D603CA7|nr:hypothetical protein DDZ14_18455 [Maritimibacter sp. 55A14]
MTDTVFICRSCCDAGEAPAGARFAQRLREVMVGQPEFQGVVVKESPCMLTCDKPVALCLRGPGKAAYQFSNVRPESDLENVLTLVRLYVSNKKGAIVDARPIGRLRHCLNARLPST